MQYVMKTRKLPYILYRVSGKRTSRVCWRCRRYDIQYKKYK